MHTVSSKVGHAMERFPKHAPQLRRLLGEDEMFADLCTEYGEAVEAIQRWCTSNDTTTRQQIAELLELREELETEIRTKLSRNNDTR